MARSLGVSFKDPKEYVVEDHEVKGLPNARLLEIRYGGNVTSQDRTVIGSISETLLIVKVLSADESLPWDEVIAITERQIDKLNRRVT
jgi:hypothetical protein